LQPVIVDSHCLDAFAGSGALGFEALSRAAADCLFVENDRVQAKAIESNAQASELDNASVIQSTWPGVKLPSKKWDVVFLDPPFNSGLIDVVWNELIMQQQLADTCLVYIEHATAEQPAIPSGFECYREKRTKQVVYALYQQVQTRR
jgi:16S rRNA (guanine966-N2)-methyltransferase